MSKEELLSKIKRYNELSKFSSEKEDLRKEIEEEIATREHVSPTYYLVA